MGRRTAAMLFVWALGLMLIAPLLVSAQAQTTEPTATATSSWVENAHDRSKQPPMALPFRAGEKWILSGAPHRDTTESVAPRNSALDFAPQEHFSCVLAENRPLDFKGVYHEAVSVSPGLVIVSGDTQSKARGWVVVDLDGDGNVRTGWAVHYAHIEDTTARAKVGTYVQPGDVIGNPGCSFGMTTLEHVHVFRTFNGEPVPADDPETPFILSGWTFTSAGEEYEGVAHHPVHGEVQRNGEPLASDNSLVGYTLLSHLNLGELEFATQSLRFRFLRDWFKPTISEAVQGGGFVNGRLSSNDGKWLLPVASRTLSSDSDEHKSRGAENALDLSTDWKAPVYAIAPGVVTYQGCNNVGNRGCQVWVQQDDGFLSIYAHLLDENRPDYLPPITTDAKGNIIRIPDTDGRTLVSNNQRVDQSTKLGRVWQTGMTAWTHIHLSVQKGGVDVRLEDYFDTEKLQHCTRCPASEWKWDETYDPLTLRVQGKTHEFVDFILGSSILEIAILFAVVVLLIIAVVHFELLASAFRLLTSMGWLVIRKVFGIRSFLRRLWWWKWASIPIGSFLSAAIPATVLAILVWLMQTGIGSAAFAQDFSNELLRRIPFRGISNNSPIPWLPDSVAYWWPEIVEAANKHDIEPEVLAILVTVESCGNPEAGSGVGATGLTQVMPSTGRGIAQQRGIADYTDGKLFDPKYNLDFGAYYFGQQMKAFSNVLDAAGAYNGGPGMMQKFLRGGAMPDETERYRTWVGGMYNDKNFESSSTFNRWSKAGGSKLCKDAAIVIAQYPAR